MSTCLNCNASETKQWQLLDGSWVCDECCLDEMQGRNERLYSQAAALVAQHDFKRKEPKILPKASGPPSQVRHKSTRTNPAGGTSKRPWGGDLDALGRGLGSPSKRGATHAQCLLCGRLWWNSQRTRCKVCRGLCRAWSDRDLSLQQRISSAYTEPGREGRDA